jgi:hypothetical protein
VTAELREDPRERSDWRRNKNWCPFYRERWFPQSDPSVGEPMYQVFCLMNTPPETLEEQERCMASRTRCWRLAGAPAQTPEADGACAEPSGTARRARRPA